MVHAIVQLTINNPESMAAYREKAGAALKKHNATVVQSSQNLSVLDGNHTLPDIGVILAFEDAEAARAWINDPELAETHQLRRDAGVCNITLLG